MGIDRCGARSPSRSIREMSHNPRKASQRHQADDGARNDCHSANTDWGQQNGEGRKEDSKRKMPGRGGEWSKSCVRIWRSSVKTSAGMLSTWAGCTPIHRIQARLLLRWARPTPRAHAHWPWHPARTAAPEPPWPSSEPSRPAARRRLSKMSFSSLVYGWMTWSPLPARSDLGSPRQRPSRAAAPSGAWSCGLNHRQFLTFLH